MFTLSLRSVEIQQIVTKQTTNIEKNMSSWRGMFNNYAIFFLKQNRKVIIFLPTSISMR